MLNDRCLEKYKDFALILKDSVRQVITKELQAGFNIEIKQDKSFVTSLDKKIERTLSEKILETYPNHGVIGEEFGETNPDAEFVWTLDPIDGTEELVSGLPTYGTIIALLYQGEPVLGLIDHSAFDLTIVGAKGIGVSCNDKQVPKLGKPSEIPRLYIGSRHQFIRGKDESKLFEIVSAKYPNLRCFCTCYGFTSLIQGQADIGFEYNLKIWDLAAIEVLVKEVGGDFVKIGEQTLESGLKLYGAIFGKKELVKGLLDLVLLFKLQQ